MGKYSLIVISGFVVVFGIIKINLNQVGGKLTDNFVEQYEKAEAKLAAQAAAQMALATLGDSSSWRTGYSGVQVGGATGWATLEDNGSDTSLSASNVRITAGGASGNAVDSTIVLAQLASAPPGVTAGSLPILWSVRLAP